MATNDISTAERLRRREILLAQRASAAGWRQRLLARRTAQMAARRRLARRLLDR